jgi:hypothetical protein
VAKLPKPFKHEEQLDLPDHMQEAGSTLNILPVRVHTPLLGLRCLKEVDEQHKPMFVHFWVEFNRMVIIQCPLPLIVGMFQPEPVTLSEVFEKLFPIPKKGG